MALPRLLFGATFIHGLWARVSSPFLCGALCVSSSEGPRLNYDAFTFLAIDADKTPRG